jgi:hypothetical protein
MCRIRHPSTFPSQWHWRQKRRNKKGLASPGKRLCASSRSTLPSEAETRPSILSIQYSTRWPESQISARKIRLSGCGRSWRHKGVAVVTLVFTSTCASEGKTTGRQRSSRIDAVQECLGGRITPGRTGLPRRIGARDAVKNAKSAKNAKNAKNANPWKLAFLALLALLDRSGNLLIVAELGIPQQVVAWRVSGPPQADSRTPRPPRPPTPGNWRPCPGTPGLWHSRPQHASPKPLETLRNLLKLDRFFVKLRAFSRKCLSTWVPEYLRDKVT